ncbi:MAG TPA: VWA domain-containing protein [Blastocatellia bacterium]|jgi:Ca-activated chloride channel family protein|nr:VWA domain-containing protein [Blastocatellia bacterium]
MRHREQDRVIIVIASVCVCIALTIGLATAQNPPQLPHARLVKQQSGDRQKKTTQRQESQSQDTGGESIKISTELVQLDVKVTDQNRRSVSGLTKGDFAVYEDKVSQNIESVSAEEAPVSMGLVIDTSGSMRPKLDTVSDAARGLIGQMRRDDEAFLVQFKTETDLVQEFTSDRRKLEDALGDLYTAGGTALLDAIIATADHAHERGQRRRKALIVITDGVEKNSSSKEKEVMEAMKEDEVQVYLVGFVDREASGGFFSKSPAKKAKDLLIRLAEDSGGRAFFPSDVGEMPAIAAQIAKELRAQYVISYYPNNSRRDGSFRSVRVTVNNRKLIAQTRQGYYAPDDGEAPQRKRDRRPR